jgi:hypothetical protein
MRLPRPGIRPWIHRSPKSRHPKRRMRVRSETAKYLLMLSFLTRPVAVLKKRSHR